MVGAHYDSERDSPGAVDNASGVALVFAAARVLYLVVGSGALEAGPTGARVNDAVIAAVMDQRPPRVLDVGCGEGGWCGRWRIAASRSWGFMGRLPVR